MKTPSYEVRGVAVDWVSNLLYLTDATNKAIHVCNYNCQDGKTVAQHVDQPHKIVVDPMAGLVPTILLSVDL